MNYNQDFFRNLLSIFGFFGAIKVIIAHLVRLKRISIFIVPIQKRVQMRPYTGDFATLRQVLGEKIHDVGLNSSARFIIDCGANVGYSSLSFASFYPKAKIIAIEPEKNNFRLLVSNTSQTTNIVPLQRAVWPSSQVLYLKDPEVRSNSFQYEQQSSNQETSEKVRGMTIDEILKQYNIEMIDLIKIDIEGAEEALFAAENLDWVKRTKILSIEPHGKKIEELIVRRMHEFGFSQSVQGEKLIFRNQKYFG